MGTMDTVYDFTDELMDLLNNKENDVRSAYESIARSAKDVCATDIVSGEFQQMRKFVELYKPLPTYDPSNDMTTFVNEIPADIILNATVPIHTLEVSVDERNRKYSKAIFAIKKETFDLTTEEYAVLKKNPNLVINVGLVQVTDTWAFPISIVYPSSKQEYILCITCVPVNIRMPYHKTAQIIKTKNPYIINDLSDMYSTAVILFNIWYGIEISLLHPVTKTVFRHPITEKISREVLKKQTGKNKAKYVRIHQITDENNTEKILLDAANATLGTSHEKRKYVRKRLLWRVIGHYRTQNGKRIFVEGFWKGPLKDIEEKRGIYEENKRVVEETTYKRKS